MDTSFEPDDGDYWRDGVIMALVDECDGAAVALAAMEAEDGAQFNIAIWAAVRLWDLTDAHYLGNVRKGGDYL